MAVLRNYNNEPIFTCTEDALNHALDIFEDPEEMKRVLTMKNQHTKRFELEKKMRYPDIEYASRIATQIQLCRECLSECDIVQKHCIKIKTAQ